MISHSGASVQFGCKCTQPASLGGLERCWEYRNRGPQIYLQFRDWGQGKGKTSWRFTSLWKKQVLPSLAPPEHNLTFVGPSRSMPNPFSLSSTWHGHWFSFWSSNTQSSFLMLHWLVCLERTLFSQIFAPHLTGLGSNVTCWAPCLVSPIHNHGFPSLLLLPCENIWLFIFCHLTSILALWELEVGMF